MASTVQAAFNEFLKGEVDLDPGDTAGARSSRDWLLGQIALLPGQHDDFPQLYSDVDLHYGSFARRTKIRELDDLDMLIGVSALGTTYADYGSVIHLSVPEGIALRRLCHEGSNLLNSRRVINKFVKHLAEVPQYQSADVKRNQQAAVLDLTSYPWSFDIVPALFTRPEADGRTYYIIPDGQGHWMKSDPRIDQARATEVNQRHEGNVLRAIRAVKFWNRRQTMPSIPSYLLECIVLQHYERVTESTAWVRIEMEGILRYLANTIQGPVADPKRIEGDINSLPWADRGAIAGRAGEDADRILEALGAELDQDHRRAINTWRVIFGPRFPVHGSSA